MNEDVRWRWGVRVPLRDGVHVSATLYLPADLTEPAPCIFTLTPYVSDTYHERGVHAAENGFPFLVVDTRGRGNSEGEFKPFIQESRDGFDVVEWIARQPYCNGKVAMWGGSYAGYDQWLTAAGRPPHLASIVPVAAPYIGLDFPMRNNIFYPYLLQWLTYVSGCTAQARIFADERFWRAAMRRWHESGWPFCELDDSVGNPSALFQEWLRHPEPDEYWDAYNPTPEQYAALEVPILTITGSYDDDQPGALEHYRRHMRYSSPAARARHYLVIGPWDHAGTRTPRREFAGLKFGEASEVDLPRLHLDWYSWTLGNGPRPAFLQRRVAYYVMGLELWRYADSLEAITERSEPFFLDSSCNADGIYSAGIMGSQPGQGSADSYRYDPRATSGFTVEAQELALDCLLTDQSVMLSMTGEQLVYHSVEFAKDTELSGFFRLVAWIAIDTPDTDFYVSVHEITRDGTCIWLSTDAMRARYRTGLRSPQLVQEDQPLRYEFDRFTFVSRQVRRGHRLRLVIAPVGRIIGETFVQKNYHCGGIVAQESAKEGRPVTVRLFHNETYPSALYVPHGACE